jgi:hypothetical protein
MVWLPWQVGDFNTPKTPLAVFFLTAEVGIAMLEAEDSKAILY